MSDPKRIIKRFREWENLPTTFSKTWSLWIDQTAYEPGKTAKQFYEGIIHLGDFSTLEEFCELWSETTDEQGWPKLGRSTSVFQKGIAPAWEHKDNALGGHWLVKINNFEKSEQVWYSLLMTILSEQLAGVHPREINGIMVSPRERGTMIYVWNRHSLNGKYKDIMQNFIRDTLDVPQHWMRYNTHKYKLNKNKTKKKEQQESARHPNSPENSSDSEHPSNQENTNTTNTVPNGSAREPAKELLPAPQSTLQEPKHPNLAPESTPKSPRVVQREEASKDEPPVQAIGEDSSESEEVSEEAERAYDHVSDDDGFLEEGQPPVGTSMEYIAESRPAESESFLARHWFTISIGFLIFIAALYNIYIILIKI